MNGNKTILIYYLQKAIIVLLVLLTSNSRAQTYFTDSQFGSMEKSSYFFVGQSHDNKANTLIELELLLMLHRTHDVRYDILEYAHSAAFLINQFLETGDDSILAFVNAGANFNFIRAVRNYNMQLPPDKRIKFFGLDFEGRQDGRFCKKAIQLIHDSAGLPNGHPLQSLLNNTAGAGTEELKQHLSRLKVYLARNTHDSRQLLGRYFIDILLIANAPYDFSPGRDDEMYSGFKRLFDELARTDERLKFFSSFGIGHINPDNRKGLAGRLRNDVKSPVRNRVTIIGVQYFNCQFGKQNNKKKSEGNLSFLCKEDALRSLVNQSNKEDVRYLPKEAISHLNCSKAISYLSGIIVIQNFGATSSWIWG